VIAATIAELPDRLAAAAIAGPAVVMIGQVFSGAAAVASSAPSASQAAG
jgi:siroheme synthase